VPGRKRCSFLIPPVAGAAFLAALFAKCFRGALAPVCLRAVYFVRAIDLFVFLSCGDEKNRSQAFSCTLVHFVSSSSFSSNQVVGLNDSHTPLWPPGQTSNSEVCISEFSLLR